VVALEMPFDIALNLLFQVLNPLGDSIYKRLYFFGERGPMPVIYNFI